MSDRAEERVVLVYPNAGQDVLGINVGLPLSVLYVGTALKEAGYQVTILDQRVQEHFDRCWLEAVRLEADLRRHFVHDRLSDRLRAFHCPCGSDP